MDVKPIPGLEQLPWAEVWFHEIDEVRWREASAAAREIGKPGLDVWTTDATPEVVAFLEERGYEEVRRYAISELDVSAADDPGPPAFPLVTFAERPDLIEALFAIARESIPRPARPLGAPARGLDEWRVWGLDPHPPEACLIAVEDDRVLGYGFLSVRGEQWWHGFTGIARAERGRGARARSSAASSRGRRRTACRLSARPTRRGSSACSR